MSIGSAADAFNPNVHTHANLVRSCLCLAGALLVGAVCRPTAKCEAPGALGVGSESALFSRSLHSFPIHILTPPHATLCSRLRCQAISVTKLTPAGFRIKGFFHTSTKGSVAGRAIVSPNSDSSCDSGLVANYPRPGLVRLILPRLLNGVPISFTSPRRTPGVQATLSRCRLLCSKSRCTQASLDGRIMLWAQRRTSSTRHPCPPSAIRPTRLIHHRSEAQAASP